MNKDKVESRGEKAKLFIYHTGDPENLRIVQKDAQQISPMIQNHLKTLLKEKAQTIEDGIRYIKYKDMAHQYVYYLENTSDKILVATISKFYVTI